MNFVLITGGAGYIGSHTCLALAQKGYQCLIVDNLCNSYITAIDKIEQILGYRPRFFHGNIEDQDLLENIFAEFPIQAVLHFAGLKSVAESVTNPLLYYQNNIFSTLCLLRAMHKANVKVLVFSSSATVYGNTQTIPYQEDCLRLPVNPYGKTKMIIEDILTDLAYSEPDWKIACLRYFNPVGAHPNGLLGENPKGVPTNLMPYMCKVAAGYYEKLNIFGNDYSTQDGTCIRDYIHVMDLASGHVAALDHIQNHSGFLTLNLGTGHGVSVLELVSSFEQATNCKIPYIFSPRRNGDLPAYWANTQKAKNLLNWTAKYNLQKMCIDSWNWEKLNQIKRLEINA
ncbi:MAG: UDP-glucose 4-epimerase GalE [Proteobacteria bacterium]|nr:UDP-glucose 4-epimerase GalE [Pseudomonadota bacterium]